MKIKWKALAVALSSLSVFTGEIALADRVFYNPYNNGRLYDATYWEWAGGDVSRAAQIAGDRYCQRRGYPSSDGYVNYVTNSSPPPAPAPAPANGTNRFSLFSATPRECLWCRWYITRVRCVP